MFKVEGALLAVLVILHPRKTVTLSDCTDDYPIADPEYVGCFQKQGNLNPFLSHQVPGVQVETANDCISCCMAAEESYNFAGIRAHPPFRCTCGSREENFYSAFTPYNDCTRCPGDNNQSCGYSDTRVSVYKVSQHTSEAQTENSTPPYGPLSSVVPTHTLQTPDSTATTSTAQPLSRSPAPVVTLHRSTRTSVSHAYEVPSPGSSVQTSVSTQPPITVSRTSPQAHMTDAPGNRTALIAGTVGGAAFLLAICGVAFCIFRKRSTLQKENNTTASIRMDGVGTSTDSASGGRNPSFQSNSNNVDALYAKPDKKRKNQQQHPNPDDPSYQDVLPTGAQHQYATVQDDPNPYTAVRDEPNLYDSIQDDPQYATVQKGRKHAPDVETNPLYGKGSVDNTAYDPEGPMSNDRAPSVCEMTDNIIYE